MKRLLTLVVVALLAGLLAACGTPDQTGQSQQSDEPVTLQLRLEAGQSYRYRTTMTQNTEAAMLGSQGYTQEMAIITRQDVVRVEPNGSAVIRATYEDFSVVAVVDGEEMTAEDLANDPTGKQLIDKLIGQSITMTLAIDGSTTKVEGLEQLVEALAGPGVATGDISKLFGQGDQAFGGDIAILPGKPVAIGESWSNDHTMGGMILPLAFVSTYTLKGRQDGEALINMSATLKLGEALSETLGLDPDIFKNLSGSQSGTLRVEESTGLVLRSESTYSVELTMDFGGKVEEVFTEINEGLSGELEGTPLPTSTPLPTATPEPEPETSSSMKLSGSVVMERIDCCEPLVRPTPRPTATPAPIPGAQELKQLIEEESNGQVSQVEILATQLVGKQLVVLYSGVSEFSQIVPGLGEPTSTPNPQGDRTLGYDVFEQGRKGWQSSGGGSMMIGTQQTEGLVTHEQGSLYGRGSGISSIAYGRALKPEVAAVEVSFSNGEVVREPIAANGSYLAVGEGADDACELRVLGAQDTVLETIDLVWNPEYSACTASDTATPTQTR